MEGDERDKEERDVGESVHATWLSFVPWSELMMKDVATKMNAHDDLGASRK